MSSFLFDTRYFVFSLLRDLSSALPPPRGSVGCATFPFRVGFRLLSHPPRRNGSLREGFDFVFPCLSACVVVQIAFLCLAPSATLTVRGRVLTVVGLVIAFFRLAPPRHTGGSRQVFDGRFALL